VRLGSAWWFDIAKGDMYAWQDDTRSFVVIDRPMAERLSEGE
jgi:carbonic anhydrase